MKNETKMKLDHIRNLVDELRTLAKSLGVTANIAFHGNELPAGVEVTGARLSVCHTYSHSSFIRGYAGTAEFFASRDATEKEVKKLAQHEPQCNLFRLEAYRASER